MPKRKRIVKKPNGVQVSLALEPRHLDMLVSRGFLNANDRDHVRIGNAVFAAIGDHKERDMLKHQRAMLLNLLAEVTEGGR